MSTHAKKMLRTEDTGKIFEMAICLAYGIPYDGKYKYSMESAETLKTRLTRLPELFPACQHTAKRGSRYDFTSVSDETKHLSRDFKSIRPEGGFEVESIGKEIESKTLHLSAKTTKKGVGKVAPQVIGQCQPKKFCEILGLEFSTVEALKEYIQTQILHVLPTLVAHTFDCPNVYYNEEKNTIRYITLETPIDWSACEFKWTCPWTEWANSSTLKVVRGDAEFALVEFQFHTKSRSNMAIRWCYENLLTSFKENFALELL